jgi:hypothetical protein
MMVLAGNVKSVVAVLVLQALPRSLMVQPLMSVQMPQGL